MVTSQFIARPYSASLYHTTPSPLITPPALPYPAADITNYHPLDAFITPCDLSCNYVLKPPQCLAYAGGHHPRLRPKKGTACTNSLKNTFNTFGIQPSLPSIFAKWAQISRAFRRLPTTDGYLLSYAVMILPKYLKDVTVLIGLLKF